MGNIASDLGQDDGEAGTNQLISPQEEQPGGQNADAPSQEQLVGDDQQSDATAWAKGAAPVGRGGDTSKRLPSSSSPNLSRAPKSPPGQRTSPRETEEQPISSRSSAASPQPVEALVTRPASGRRLSLFARSLILAGVTLSLVSSLLFLVTWKLFNEHLAIDLARNTSAVMRLLQTHNASSTPTPGPVLRNSSSSVVNETAIDGNDFS